MNVNKKKISIFTDFLKKQKGWLCLIFIILGVYTIVRTYSISYISKIVDLLEKGETITQILLLALIGFCFAASGYILRYVGSILCVWLSEKLALETRNCLTEHLQKIPYITYEKMNTGQLQSVLRNDVQKGSDLIYTYFSRILQNVQLFITTFLYMFLIQPWMAIGVATLILLMAYLNQKILVKQKQYQKISRDAAGEVSNSILSVCHGMATIKAYSAEKFATKLFADSKKKYNYNEYRVEAIDAGRLSVYSLANYATQYFSIIYFGYQGIQDASIIGDALVFIVLLRQLLLPAEVIFRWMSNAVVGLASWERIYEILDIPEEKQEQIDLPTPQNIASAKEITFGYSDEKNILQGVNVDFQKDKIVILRGRSGCGKTTLCKALCGLYKEASIIWNIDNYENMIGNARKWIVYSPSQAEIFSMSIYENLVFNQQNISKEMCMNLADELGIGDWIRSLPQGIDTILESGGRNCSGGQRQTLMNMRAILSEKPVLILDEACSALDVEKRKKLLAYLHKAKTEKAIILVTHQEEVAKQCDLEVVLA